MLVAPSDAYPGIRAIARDVLEPNGVEVRLVPTDDDAVRAALPGATLVWLESPSNPGLDVLDLPALIAEAHAARRGRGRRQHARRPAAPAPARARRRLLGHERAPSTSAGHSDLIMGAVAVADDERADGAARVAHRHGLDPGAVRGLAGAPLAGHAGRCASSARRPTRGRWPTRCGARDDVTGVRWPGVGSVVCFDVGSQARADAFLDACELVAEATSFGGLHSNAERRARWGSDDVGEGFIRFNAGIEDAPDLVADVERALELSRP